MLLPALHLVSILAPCHRVASGEGSDVELKLIREEAGVGKLMVGLTRILPLCAVLLPLVLLVPTEAFADEAISVSPSSGPVGQAVIVTGTGWHEHAVRGLDVPIWIGFGNEVARGHPDANGEFSVGFAIPINPPPEEFINGKLRICAIIGNGGAALAFYTVTSGPGQLPPRLTLSLNQSSLQSGDTHILTAIVTPGGSASPVDVYLAIQLPDQTLHFYQSNGSFTVEMQPLVRNWTATPFSGEIFRHLFTGAEQAGTYTWYGAFTAPGTQNIIGDIAQATFTFNTVQSQLPPEIVRVETFREGQLVFFRVFYTDPNNDAEGFGFRGANGFPWAEETHPFSSPSYGRVYPG